MAIVAAACGDSDSASDPAADTTQAAAVSTTAAPADDMAEDDMAEDDMAEDDMAGEMGAVRFTVTVENLTGDLGDIRRVGVFNTPDGAEAPGPLLPGEAYRSAFAAAAGERLSFATMFVQSNDWIIAPGAEGIELFDADGNPIEGDITNQLAVFDVGTEIDQVPGEGADQAPRQSGPDTGDEDPNAVVRDLTDRSAADYVNVSVVSLGDGNFELVITNVSSGAALTTPFAPGVTVVHEGSNPLFTLGDADLGEGLEALAEDGNPAPLFASLDARAGVPSPIAPVAAVVHQSDTNPIFVVGTDIKAEGLEGLAEDGGPGGLVDSIGAIATAVPVGGTDPGPAGPGQSYTFDIEATEGDRLSLAFMFVQSNDWFFAIDGLELYADGTHIEGDISDAVNLYDAGTEADQVSGVGSDQAPRQAGPNTGEPDADTTVRLIDTNDGLVRVTIAAN